MLDASTTSSVTQHDHLRITEKGLIKMNAKTQPNSPVSRDNNSRALYRTIWRWHFYAGIFSIPFVIILALTGAIYLFKPYYEHWQESDYHGLQITGDALAPNQQITAALAAIEGGKLLSYRLVLESRHTRVIYLAGLIWY